MILLQIDITQVNLTANDVGKNTNLLCNMDIVIILGGLIFQVINFISVISNIFRPNNFFLSNFFEELVLLKK